MWTVLRGHFPGFCCNLLNHSSHLTRYSFNRFTQKIKTPECHIKNRTEVWLMSPVKVASKSLYESSAVSLFARLPTPVLLVAHGIAAMITVMLPGLFRVFPTVFKEKRHCSLSTFSIIKKHYPIFWKFFLIPPIFYDFGNNSLHPIFHHLLIKIIDAPLLLNCSLDSPDVPWIINMT